MDAGKGQVPRFQAFTSLCLPSKQPQVSESNEREFANVLVSRAYLSSHWRIGPSCPEEKGRITSVTDCLVLGSSYFC